MLPKWTHDWMAQTWPLGMKLDVSWSFRATFRLNWPLFCTRIQFKVWWLRVFLWVLISRYALFLFSTLIRGLLFNVIDQRARERSNDHFACPHNLILGIFKWKTGKRKEKSMAAESWSGCYWFFCSSLLTSLLQIFKRKVSRSTDSKVTTLFKAFKFKWRARKLIPFL